MLTGAAVDTLMNACMAAAGPDGGRVTVAGVMRNFTFDEARIAEHTAKISALLAELPEQFHLSSGGGSFLNACYDRHGRQWTGLHVTMEALFALGIAAGRARWLMAKDTWDMLPGGVPYVVVEL